MTIVTKTGDKGETGLFGGQRVSKADARIDAYGTVDELNALLGVVLSEGNMSRPLSDRITRMQHHLFRVGADLATPLVGAQKVPRVEASHVEELETWINEWEAALPALQWFILPGGSRGSALLQHARTVCRRAERTVVALMNEEEINRDALIYLNRLSDALFLLARMANREQGGEEIRVEYT